MTISQLEYVLNDGNKIPAIALGTYQSEPNEVTRAVEIALRNGYRHIDCAYLYENEAEVGLGLANAIKDGIVSRDEVFITTKVWPSFHDKVEESVNESLANLGLDYADLILIHWPMCLNSSGNHPYLPTREDGSSDVDESASVVDFWKRLEAVKAAGKARSIGVSNFRVSDLEELLPHVSVVPATNQIENHPLCPQLDIVEYCKKHNILIQCHSPFGSTGAPEFKNPAVLAVADKYKISPGKVLLSWHVTQGRNPLPKSTIESEIVQNLEPLVDLDDESIALLNSSYKTEGIMRIAVPDFMKGKWPDF